MTHEEYIEKINKIHGDNYEILSEYKNYREKILVRHTPCGTTKEVLPQSLVKSKTCSRCAGNFRMTLEEMRAKVLEVTEGKVEVLGVEDPAKRKLKVHSKVCNHTYVTGYNNIISRKTTTCSKCSQVRKGEKLTLDEEQFYKKYPHVKEFKFSNYLASDKKAVTTHLKCGYVWEVVPGNLGRKVSSCPRCSRREQIDDSNIHMFMDVEEFQIDSNFNSADDEVSILHRECGNTFTKKLKAFLRYKSCPHCRVTSRGEEFVSNILVSGGYHYKREYTFPGLKGVGGGSVRFDFAVLNKELTEKVVCLIEFDGEQHNPLKAEKVQIFGKDTKTLLLNDMIKDEYCTSKGIPLLRIKYGELKNKEKLQTKITNFITSIS